MAIAQPPNEFEEFSRRLRKTVAENGAALVAFIVVSAVLLFVPQVTNVWWNLPFSIQGAQGFAFTVAVPGLLWFFFAAWLTLVQIRGEDSILLIGLICLLTLMLIVWRLGLPWFGDTSQEFEEKSFNVVIATVALFSFFITWAEFLKARWQWVATFKKIEVWPLNYAVGVLYFVSFFNGVILSVHDFIIVRWPKKLEEAYREGRVQTLRRCAAVCLLSAMGCLLTWLLYNRGPLSEIVPAALGDAILGQLVIPLGLLTCWLFVMTGLTLNAPRKFLHMAPPLSPLCRLTGQMLFQILIFSFLGIAIWLLAAWFPDVCSYRLYTIWSVFFVGFVTIAVATWIDSVNWAPTWDWVPFRPIAFLLLLVLPFVFNWPADLAPRDAFEKRGVPAPPPDWYDACWKRLEHIEKNSGTGPFVLVAASGGGSRAALFTGLVLDRLAGEKLPGEKSGTWGDRVLLVSSVSGGSLATGYYAFTKGSTGTKLDSPRNSFLQDLRRRSADQFAAVKEFYLPSDRPGRLQTLELAFEKKVAELEEQKLEHAEALRQGHEWLREEFLSDPDFAWSLQSQFADAMCTDFMAPILRACLVPDLERGKSLSRFWAQEFDWKYRPTGELPRDFDNLLYEPSRPLVVFNTTDVSAGNRFLLGFPQLPRRAFSLHIAPAGLDTHIPRTQSLADFRPAQRVLLPDAVRASASFPWGVPSVKLRGTAPQYDFADAALREQLKAGLAKEGGGIAKLLPRESRLGLELRWLDEKPAVIDKNRVLVNRGLNQIVRQLEALAADPHAPAQPRAIAFAILENLKKLAPAAPAVETDVNAMDGGINDNTGIATVMEMLRHLDAAAYADDPLLDQSCKDKARQILERLRERGVVFLEIDSGGKGSAERTHELKKPLQAMDNAAVATALESRQRHLEDLQHLLAPRGYASSDKGPLYWALPHVFICNHRDADDVMTCWALGPDDKARVLATFYCQYQLWKQDLTDAQAETSVQKWLAGHDAALRAARQQRDQPFAAAVTQAWQNSGLVAPGPEIAPSTRGLEHFTEQARKNEKRRSDQQRRLLRSQERIKD